MYEDMLNHLKPIVWSSSQKLVSFRSRTLVEIYTRSGWLSRHLKLHGPGEKLSKLLVEAKTQLGVRYASISTELFFASTTITVGF
jgi:hypothetical protein